MKKFYFQGFIVAFLLLVAQISFAQDKLLPVPVSSESDLQSLSKVQPAVTEKISARGSLELPPSMIYPAKEQSSGDAGEINSSPGARLKSQAIITAAGMEVTSGEKFDCAGTPIGLPDTYVVEKGQTLTVAAPGLMANDIDPNGDVIIVSNFIGPTNGTLTSIVTNGSFSYVPSPGFTGTDQFSYTLLDADNNYSDPVTVTIHVLGDFDRKPLGISDSYGTGQETPLVIGAPGLLANDLDPDGDAIIVSNFIGPSNGMLTSIVTSGSFTYVPADGFTGTDQFQYTLLDADGNYSDPVVVTIEVFGAFNRKPLGNGDFYGTLQNTALVVPAPGLLANDLDPDGDAIIVSNFIGPTNGILTSIVTNGSFTYVPNAGFTGSDQFSYTLLDADGNYSDPVIVTLEVVAPGGDKPIGMEDHYAVETGKTLTVAAPGNIANDFDPDGDSFIVSNFIGPTSGTLTSIVTNGSFTYVPNPGFTGTDQFSYTLLDADGNYSDPVAVKIEVLESFNRKPLGIPDHYGTSEGTPLVVNAPGLKTNDLDPDGDTFIVSNFIGPTNGTLTSIVTSGSFSYVPNTGFTGTDQFTYTLLDANNVYSDPVTVTIEVFESFNRKPVAVSDHYATPEGTALVVAAPGLRTNDIDPDGDTFIVSNFVGPANGTLTSIVTSGSFTYVPDAGFTGTDQFSYILLDAEGNYSDQATVTIEVIRASQPPVASAADITTECEGPAGTTVNLDGSATSNPDDGELQYTWYENGMIIAGPSTLPTAEVQLATGVYTITLWVEDACGNTSSDDATVTVEDTTAPLVEAAFLPADKPNAFTIFCVSEDLCSDIASSVSVIRVPGLSNPKLSLKNNMNYALDIDVKKNSVSVSAPDAAAFWAMIAANGGVKVNEGQVITVKYDKNKHKFGFDQQGNLVSVMGDVVTLRCTATDSHGNTGTGEATLPATLLQSLDIEPALVSDQLKAGTINPSGFDADIPSGLHRNYPNPFARSTLIEFELEAPAFVTVSVYDDAGRMVQELSARQMSAGVQQVTWDATSRKPGMYFYRVAYNSRQLSGKMVLIGSSPAY
jgi:hypothetical protein